MWQIGYDSRESEEWREQSLCVIVLLVQLIEEQSLLCNLLSVYTSNSISRSIGLNYLCVCVQACLIDKLQFHRSEIISFEQEGIDPFSDQFGEDYKKLKSLYLWNIYGWNQIMQIEDVPELILNRSPYA